MSRVIFDLLLGAVIGFGLAAAIFYRRGKGYAFRTLRQITDGDEGKTGYISEIWAHPAFGGLFTVVLEPESFWPKVVILRMDKMLPGIHWQDDEVIVIRNGLVVPVTVDRTFNVGSRALPTEKGSAY